MRLNRAVRCVTASFPQFNRRSRPAFSLVALVVAATMAGCSFIPEYTRPDAPIAADWPIPAGGEGVRTDTATAVPAAGVGWRQFFLDERLQDLITLALDNNRDLRTAILNIEAARAQYNIQRSALAPTIGVGATGTRQRLPGDLSPSGQTTIASQYQVGVSMPTFELDLFGRLRSLSQAALAQYLATEEARRNVQITLIAQVAETWLNLYAIEAQVALTERTLESRQQSYDLVEARVKAGVASTLELNQAQTLLDTARSNLYALYRAREQARNALTLLTGVAELPPPDLDRLRRQTPILAAIPAGLPSQVLLSRPDVLAAEQQLIAANANIGAARAAFFPNISLTALLGTASAQLSNLFTGGSLAWNFTPQITAPIYTGGSLRSQLELAEIRRDIAVAQYEQTIQQAFREVADALAGTATYQRQIEAETSLVDAAQRSLDLARLRYENGVDSFLQVQDAQRTLYSAQQQLVQTRLAELQNRVALYKALGGGWLENTLGLGAEAAVGSETGLATASETQVEASKPPQVRNATSTQ